MAEEKIAIAAEQLRQAKLNQIKASLDAERDFGDGSSKRQQKHIDTLIQRADKWHQYSIEQIIALYT